MKHNLTDIIARLYATSGIDPGNPKIPNITKFARFARLGVMDDGRLLITDKQDQRGKKEGMLVLLNPYKYQLQDVDSLNEALSNPRIRDAVMADLLAAGVELTEE